MGMMLVWAMEPRAHQHHGQCQVDRGEVCMADWWDHKQRWRRRWLRWHGRLQDRLEAWRQRRQAAAEVRMARRRRRMDDVIEEGIQQALTKTLLSQMSGDVLDRLLAEVWAQHREELQAQALDAVREEHRQALEDLQERLRDGVAQERRQLERDADALVEQGIRDGIADEKLDYEDRLAELRGQRNQAREQRDMASHLLLELVRQLLGPKPVYLSSHGVAELDLYRLNTVLSRHGLRVKSRKTVSERQVQTRLDLTRVEPRTVFWLESVPVGTSPAPDEDDEEDTPAEPVPALPPAAEGAP
jgi:hypothetical protein